MKLAILTIISALMFVGAEASAACEVVKDGAKTAFDGANLSGLQVEKKSLVPLNKEFPALNVVEKAFKGEVQTCTTCSSGYIACN